MLKSYRKSEAWDYDIFLRATAAVLCLYDVDTINAVTDLGSGLRTRKPWPPDASEVRTSCEEIEGPRRRARQRELLERQQLAERKQIEDQRKKTPKQTLDDMRAELVARGFKGYDNHVIEQIAPKETAETARGKFGLTQEQWDALPNAPTRDDYWQGVRWSK